MYCTNMDCNGLHRAVLGSTGLVSVDRMISLDDMHSENILQTIKLSRPAEMSRRDARTDERMEESEKKSTNSGRPKTAKALCLFGLSSFQI